MTHPFLSGMLVMGCFIAGLCFLRFWIRMRDRLFLIFAGAFWLLALNWLLLALFHRDEAGDALFYLIRLLAFVLILTGIADKNRQRPSA